MIKNSNLQKNTLFQAYIFSCLDFSSYTENEPETTKQKIKLLKETFESEYGWRVKQIGKQKAVLEYVKGLPTCLTVNFYNNEIVEKGIQWQFIDQEATDNEKIKFIERYWKKCAMFVTRLLNNTVNAKEFERIEVLNFPNDKALLLHPFHSALMKEEKKTGKRAEKQYCEYLFDLGLMGICNEHVIKATKYAQDMYHIGFMPTRELHSIAELFEPTNDCSGFSVFKHGELNQKYEPTGKLLKLIESFKSNLVYPFNSNNFYFDASGENLILKYQFILGNRKVCKLK